MNTEILKEIGMTNTEIKVYVAMLELGSSLASVISRKSNVERAVTYHTVEKLIRKGMASHIIRENRKYFSAADPEKLGDLHKDKEIILHEAIEELNRLKMASKETLSVEVFRGVEGFKTVLDDIIRGKKPYFIIGYTGRAPKISKFWYAHWQKRRIKNKIPRYVLVDKGNEKQDALKYSMTKIRIMSEKTITEPKTSTIVYGNDKVLLFLPLEEFAGIRIKNKEVHNSYKEYFDILWKSAVNV